MKILTLFLALFLALLPDSVPFVNNTLGQDICVEEVCDVEEEAIIRSPQRTPERLQASSEPLFKTFKPAFIRVPRYHPIHFCFERQWLKACMLRL